MRPSKLKLNDKQKMLVFLFKFLYFSWRYLLLQHWTFADKSFCRYFGNLFL